MALDRTVDIALTPGKEKARNGVVVQWLLQTQS